MASSRKLKVKQRTVAEDRSARVKGDVTHGLFLLKRAFRELGSRAIDKRTRAGKRLARWKFDLIKDLGGSKAVSVQQATIIELAGRTKFILDSLDAWLLSQQSLVDSRRRSVIPVLRERQRLADTLARQLESLGLERREPPQPTLHEVARAHYGPDAIWALGKREMPPEE